MAFNLYYLPMNYFANYHLAEGPHSLHSGNKYVGVIGKYL